MHQKALHWIPSLMLGVVTLVGQGYVASVSHAIPPAKPTAPAVQPAPVSAPVPAPATTVVPGPVTAPPVRKRTSGKQAMIVQFPGVTLAPVDPLTAVNDPSIRAEHQAMAREILGVLPVACQKQLRNFYVLYTDPKHRGAAGRSVIIVNGLLQPQAFRSQLLHEMQHFVDLTCINGTAESPASAFQDGKTPIPQDDPSVEFYSICWESTTVKRPDCIEQSFASTYGATDPFEDFAEAGFAYLAHRTRFAEQAQKDPAMARKYRWFQQHYPVTQTLAVGSRWDGKVGYSISKLPYTWNTGTLAASLIRNP